MYDWVIIGAGVSGALIAQRLSVYPLKILIIEKENDVACGATKANSALIHAGYDAPFDSLRGRLNVEGNTMYDDLSKLLKFPFKRIGSLVLGKGSADYHLLMKLYDNGSKLNIPGLEIIEKERLHQMEPNVNAAFDYALYAPTAGITEPWEVAIAACEFAMNQGTELMLNTEVTRIEKSDSGFIINEVIFTKGIINAAGVHADDIYQLVDSEIEFSISPRRGAYFLLDKEAGDLVNHILFTCPTNKGKGTIIAPTAHGNIIIGPNSEKVEKDYVNTTFEGLHEVKENALNMIPECPLHLNIANFSGVRAEPSTGDFIIEESRIEGFINVAGIKSPGLSAAPAIAKMVEGIVSDIHVRRGSALGPIIRKPISRRARLHFSDLSEADKIKAISEEPKHAHIVCRCEQVTEAEIIDAIQRDCGARTLNGVKRRVRPGAGRCQGGFCGPKVVEILARELGIDRYEVEQERKGSFVLSGGIRNE